jgi:hypothetical protein
MNFYTALPPDQQEYAAAHMRELLLHYLPDGTTLSRIEAALEELNPYVNAGRAIAFTQQDQMRVLDWLRKG